MTYLRDIDLPTVQPTPVTGRPMIIDSFAGGGGASTGIEMALGRSPDVAINHDPAALAMHEINHPETRHLINSIYAVDPRDVVPAGRRVGLAWFSPDCKHHSKAKGGKPVEKNIRDLAWVVVHWAERVRPDVIMLENVEEFQDWCPLTADNKPDLTRRGETFREWVKRLRRLGYKVEWRQLRACDYGAPTIRKRLFVIARRDGLPIIWPEPTHGAPDSAEVIAGTKQPWRTAAEIIDWSLPCPSIFDTSAEIMAKHGLRAVRPLKDATLRRIARGVMRYVIEAKQPFVVTYGQHGGANRSALDPMHTITASTKDQNAVIVPTFVVTCNHSGDGFRGQGLDEPFKTLTATRDAHGLVVPHLMTMRNAGKPFTAANEPTHTITAGGAHMMAVAAFLAQHNAGPRMETNAGRPADAPLSTLTTRGTQQQIVAAHLMPHYGASVARSAEDPVGTLTAGGQGKQAVVAAHLMNMHGTQRSARDIAAPHPSICAGGQHGAIIAAFLQKYYGQGLGQEAGTPLHTLGTRDTFGLVTVEIDGQTYAITDIGMRMLTPREQFRAQGFPETYVIDRAPDGRAMTKTEQTRMCGNSVCPPLAQALVSANCANLAEPTHTPTERATA